MLVIEASTCRQLRAFVFVLEVRIRVTDLNRHWPVMEDDDDDDDAVFCGFGSFACLGDLQACLF